mgnify:CR=1 FL=1
MMPVSSPQNGEGDREAVEGPVPVSVVNRPSVTPLSRRATSPSLRDREET